MKKLTAFLLVGILAFSFVGCGEKKAVENKPVAGHEVLDSGILKDMESTNNLDSLIEKYGKITLNATDRSGGVYCVHLEKNEDGYRYYTFDATGVEYAITPEGQFLVTSDGESNAILFTSDEEKETLQVGSVDAVRGNMYQYTDKELVASQEEKDGKLVVTTVVHMTAEVEGYLEFKSAWGIDDEEFDFYNEYVLDKTTLEILETGTYCELSTGRVNGGKITILYGQDYEISDELKACMESAK